MLRAMATPNLREQNAAATRERILSAVASLIERGDADELTVPEVAEASGISLRTVYRYYPTRDELLEAAGRWIGSELMGHAYPETLDEVAETYRLGIAEFAERPGLVRALALSQLGRKVRGYRRRERLAAIRKVLEAEIPGLTEEELRRAEAVLAYLHNMLAFTTMHEENNLTAEQIGEAVAWAIRTLVDDLRRTHQTKERK
jgi:AcrR family transcriptional regulator